MYVLVLVHVPYNVGRDGTCITQAHEPRRLSFLFRPDAFEMNTNYSVRGADTQTDTQKQK
jgi:hypothetical protein